MKQASSSLLQNLKTSAIAKSVAARALSQAKSKRK